MINLLVDLKTWIKTLILCMQDAINSGFPRARSGESVRCKGAVPSPAGLPSSRGD
jgi:hypothetical protein